MTEFMASYLAHDNKEKRMHTLATMHTAGETIAPQLCADLLCLPIDIDEQTALLEASCGSDTLAFEDLVSRGCRIWNQDLCTFALRKWAMASEHLLGYRFLSSLSVPHTPQRVKFTLLDLNLYLPGYEVLAQLSANPGLEDLSPAFHALLFHRSLQWRFFDPGLERIAQAAVSSLLAGKAVDAKLISELLPWLAVWKKTALIELNAQSDGFEVWQDYAKALLHYPAFGKRDLTALGQLANAQSSDGFWQNFVNLWPPLWQRHSLSSAAVTLALQACIRQRASFGAKWHKLWEAFAGLQTDTLLASLLALDEGMEFAQGLGLVHGLLPWTPSEVLSTKIKSQLQTVAQPQNYLAELPLRWRLMLQEGQEGQEAGSDKATRFSQVLAEEKAFRAANFSPTLPFTDFSSSAGQQSAEERARHNFFSVAYLGQACELAPKEASQFWSLLSHNWLDPQEAELPAIALLARQQPYLYHSVYVNTLARFKGSDAAVLKLLDFIRTSQPQLLSEVLGALGAIGTSRALQELLSSITRPNMTVALQLEAANLLKGKDLSGLQGELRSAVAVLNPKAGRVAGVRELCEALKALLLPTSSLGSQGSDVSVDEGGPLDGARALDGESLDQALRVRISQLDELSMEVRRALRTAQFFSQQVGLGKNSDAMDLSPLIDMQYKALELLFREEFEEACAKFINLGSLQRKLDVLGYSRPIVHAMDDFERYMSLLPVIRDIPYFSKFKLRKMLRALCQFRPGKRFTLDGLKAFALFFLCFGRKKCAFGLADMLSLGFSSDDDLFHFCKQLHIFQDFRNRAAHEGFRPEAREDIEGIWQHTAEIIAAVKTVKTSMQAQLRGM